MKMKNKLASFHFIGWSFGIMTAASWDSYHSKLAVLIAFLFLVGGIITADLSGPDDPVEK